MVNRLPVIVSPDNATDGDPPNSPYHRALRCYRENPYKIKVLALGFAGAAIAATGPMGLLLGAGLFSCINVYNLHNINRLKTSIRRRVIFGGLAIAAGTIGMGLTVQPVWSSMFKAYDSASDEVVGKLADGETTAHASRSYTDRAAWGWKNAYRDTFSVDGRVIDRATAGCMTVEFTSDLAGFEKATKKLCTVRPPKHWGAKDYKFSI